MIHVNYVKSANFAVSLILVSYRRPIDQIHTIIQDVHHWKLNSLGNNVLIISDNCGIIFIREG